MRTSSKNAKAVKSRKEKVSFGHDSNYTVERVWTIEINGINWHCSDIKTERAPDLMTAKHGFTEIEVRYTDNPDNLHIKVIDYDFDEDSLVVVYSGNLENAKPSIQKVVKEMFE